MNIDQIRSRIAEINRQLLELYNRYVDLIIQQQRTGKREDVEGEMGRISEEIRLLFREREKLTLSLKKKCVEGRGS
jgi:hypothetical protein